MALESATYISDLVSSNPSAGDPVSQADDHVRTIKQVLKNTFPNITGPVLATQAEINSSMPTGLISLWYSTAISVPATWGICDGSTYLRADGTGNIVAPDLRDRFVLGVGPLHAQGSTGGASTGSGTSGVSGSGITATSASAGVHTHGGATGGTSLTTAQMPAHTHTGAPTLATGTAQKPGLTTDDFGLRVVNQTLTNTGSAGTGDAHSHTIASEGAHNHTITVSGNHSHSVTVDTVPPYYSLIWIMKL